MALDNRYADRAEGLFYSKSDEKFTVRALLEEIFGNRSFARALDVGPGPGHISGPLATRTRHLTMVELLPQYEEMLKRLYDGAEIIIDAVENVELEPHFEVILLSHVLYYQAEETWLQAVKRLYDLLLPGGELILIMNTDAGDWWKIIHPFWDRLRPHIGFYYTPMSQFKKDLATIATPEAHSYRYQVWIEPGDTFQRFVGIQLLEIEDEAVLKSLTEDIAALEKGFKQVDGSLVLDFTSELIRLRKI